MDDSVDKSKNSAGRWLNGTVLGIGLASLFSDWAHETATTLLPPFLASLGVEAVWLGVIEGVADGLSSAAKLASGFGTDRLTRRKPVAVAGYLITALGTAAFGLATAAWHVLAARSAAWLGRGIRTPIRKALLAGAVTKRNPYGRAFGLERMMDTLGAILGPATAFVLLPLLNHNYRRLFALTLIPGLAAACGDAVPGEGTGGASRWRMFRRGKVCARCRRGSKKLLWAVGLFGAGDFAHSLFDFAGGRKKIEAFAGSAGCGGRGNGIIRAAQCCLRGLRADCRVPAGGPVQQGAAAGGVAYLIAAMMALGVMLLPMNVWTLALIFPAGRHLHGDGGNTGVIRSPPNWLSREGTARDGAFGTLATVNGIGDFLSSVIVGLLWSAFGTTVAFSYSAVLFVLGGAAGAANDARDGCEGLTKVYQAKLWQRPLPHPGPLPKP